MTTAFQNDLQAALGTRYVIERELGGGGMARVFVATESALERQVVVKVLPPTTAAAISVERFRREIQFVARLQHAHIVPLLAAGEAGGAMYYTMPLVRGETLRARLARGGALPVAEAVAITRDVAKAIAYAHREGVVHRDIKPENILLTEHDALVTDFGVSKALTAAANESSGITSAGVALGTPAYMAPEQAAADPQADHRVDLYALGLVVYEMLAGSAPFAGRTPHAMIAAHVAEPPEPLAQRRPTVPPLLAELTMRCLGKNPADRPQSADEIVRALDGVQTPSATPDDAPPAVLPPLPDARRTSRRTLGIAAAIATVVLVAAGGALAWRFRTPPALVDGTAIAVLPFRVVGGDASLRMMREGIPDLVAAKLTSRIHTLDVRTVLAAWRRAGGSETTELARDDALRLARRLGAGAVIEGNAVATGREVVLSGTLLRVDGARDRQATARGAPAALPVLLDSLVGKLLVLDAGESDERASSLAGVPVAALQSYLAGRALDRAGRYGDAVEAYGRAMDADTTFALAALRYWMTASNWVSTARVAEARRLAARHADRLGSRDRLLLGRAADFGHTAEIDRPRSCAETLRDRERGVAQAPDMPDLWYLLGETLAHCGPAMGLDDAFRRALVAFDRVLALDSTYLAAREHMPVLYELLGDTARAVRENEALVHSTPDADLRALLQFFSPDSATARIGRAALLRSAPSIAQQAVAPALRFREARLADALPPVLDHVERGAVTSADRARFATLLHGYALARGQPSRAARAMRADPAGPDPALALLDATFWDGDSTLALEARAAARRAIATRPDSATYAAWTTGAFALGAFAASRGEYAETQRAIDALRALPPLPGLPWSVERARTLALLLDVEVAQATGRGDAADLLTHADSTLREAPAGPYVDATGNLIVAAAWERAGDLARAYAAVQRLRFTTALPYALSTYVRERARLAARVGDREAAIVGYRHYLTLRAVAEPSLASHLASVRQALATLERASAGK